MKNKNIDFVMNFEELGALFIGRKIDVMQCEETPLDTESSRQGRSFCRTGGVADSIKALSDKTKPCIVNGFTKDSVKQLKKYAKDGKCEGCNIIEVMCCEGGCLGGNATINQIKTAHKIVEDFASKSKDISKE
jgi:iron only hydrogenase large subunit-like protein